MRFLLLIHGDHEAEAALTSEERRAMVGAHMSYADMLRARGAHLLGEALDDPSTAAVVRPGAHPLVIDGPFVETKEAVGGFYIVECATREEAIELAGNAPQSPGAVVEVLTIAEPDATGTHAARQRPSRDIRRRTPPGARG